MVVAVAAVAILPFSISILSFGRNSCSGGCARLQNEGNSIEYPNVRFRGYICGGNVRAGDGGAVDSGAGNGTAGDGSAWFEGAMLIDIANDSGFSTEEGRASSIAALAGGGGGNGI